MTYTKILINSGDTHQKFDLVDNDVSPQNLLVAPVSKTELDFKN